MSTSGTNVGWYLNENSGDVVIYKNGVPTDLGALSAGTYNFNISGVSTYSISVSKAADPGYNYFASAPNYNTATNTGTISTGQANIIANVLLGTTYSKGIAVNEDPTSPAFGRVYDASGGIGTSYGNPDLTGITQQNGGITYNSLSTSSPLRLTIGPNDNVYISDWNTSSGAGMMVLDPNLNALPTGTLVLSGRGSATDPTVHGAISSKVFFTGSPSTGNFNVIAIDGDLHVDPTNPPNLTTTVQSGAVYNSIWDWNLGASSLNYNASPTKISDMYSTVNGVNGVIADLARNPTTGNYYMLESRSVGTEPAIIEVSPTGTKLWDSLTASQSLSGNSSLTDLLRNNYGVMISPDGKSMILAGGSPTPEIEVIPLDSSGTPILAEARIAPVGAGSFSSTTATEVGRDLGIDAAGNIYLSASNGSAGIAVLSPGGLTSTTYSNNAAGTAGAFTSNTYDPTWTSTGGGNFSDSSKWLMNYSPSPYYPGLSAKFGSTITADSTINLDYSPQLGTVTFDSSHKYTLTGSGLTLTTFDPAGAQVNVINGNHEIAVPVYMSSNTTVTITHAADSITFSGGISPQNPVSLTVGGAGTTNIPALNSNNFTTLSVTGGSLKLTASRASSNTGQITDLSVGSGATLDVGSNDLIDNYNNGGSADATRLSTIQGLLKSGYSGGTWTGKGITSSAAAAIAASSNIHKTALGYTEASADAISNHNGIGLDNDSIVIVYTYAGDATLDGSVDSNDFAALAANYGQTSSVGWIQGDFNYDGTVNALDFNALATNYGATSLAASGAVPDASAMALGSIVPEPTTLSLLGMAAIGMMARRRRNV